VLHWREHKYGEQIRVDRNIYLAPYYIVVRWFRSDWTCGHEVTRIACPELKRHGITST
jgi:hypothetical protein